MDLLQVSTTTELDLIKIVGYLFNLALAIIGYFIIRTLNSVQKSIEENKREIATNRDRISLTNERLVKTNSRLETIEKVNGAKLDLILDQQKRMFEKFDEYDRNIQSFYQDYDLKKK